MRLAAGMVEDAVVTEVRRILQTPEVVTQVLAALKREGGGASEADEFATIRELAEAVGLAERHVSRQLRLAYLGPEVLKRLTCGREAAAVNLYDLCFLSGEAWGEQAERALG